MYCCDTRFILQSLATLCLNNYYMINICYKLVLLINNCCTVYLGKRRRSNGGFLGSEVILQQLKVPPKRKRVGLVSHGPPQRSNMAVLDSDGEEIGVVTSAAYSPNLGYNVGMAFVPRKTKLGSEVELKIRNKTITAKVVKMPFIPACYHKSN